MVVGLVKMLQAESARGQLLWVSLQEAEQSQLVRKASLLQFERWGEFAVPALQAAE